MCSFVGPTFNPQGFAFAEDQNNENTFFSDSITLRYNKSQANMWKTFVANRISQIQNLSDSADWHHVNSQSNPADILCRGAYGKELIYSKFYCHGREFPMTDLMRWFSREPKLSVTDDMPEKRKIVLSATTIDVLPVFSFKFSSFIKLQIVKAYPFCFIDNLFAKSHRILSALTTRELDRSRDVIITQAFSKEIESLSKRQTHTHTSKANC